MEWSDIQSRLRRASAYGSGQGPQYEKQQMLQQELERERAAEAQKRQQAQAAALTKQIAAMYQRHGEEGAAMVLGQARGQFQGTPMESAIDGYSRLLMDGDTRAFQMELDSDLAELGVDISPSAPNYESVQTGEDGLRYGINNGKYEPIPSPEGVRFKQPGTTVNVGKGEPSMLGAITDAASADYASIQESARSQGDVIQSLRAVKAFLPKLETGVTAPARQKIGAVMGDVFGPQAGELFYGDVPAAEAFTALTQKMVNNELMLQKGPQTEGDAQRAMQTVAGLGKTMEANRFIVNYAESLAMRKQEMGQFINSQMQGSKPSLERFNAAKQSWESYINQTPLVSTGAVRDPATGVPVTLGEFVDNYMQRTKKSREDAIKEWQKRHAEAQSSGQPTRVLDLRR